MIIGHSKESKVENIENNQEKENPAEGCRNVGFPSSRMWPWGVND